MLMLPATPGRDQARMVDLHQQACHADDQQEIGQVGVAENQQEFFQAAHGQVDHWGAQGLQPDLSTAAQGHRPALQLVEQIGQVLGPQVDQVLFQGLGVREGLTFQHGLLCRHRVAPVGLGQGAYPGGGVLGDLLVGDVRGAVRLVH